MARIRTIKPEFWTDEKIVGLSFATRLFFIGMWNFCDDEGRGEYSPIRLKNQIFPADDTDISVLIGELRREKLIEVYTIDNKLYYQISGFAKHQKIDHRRSSKHPAPPQDAPMCADVPRNSPMDQGRDQGSRNGMEVVSADAEKEDYAFDGKACHLTPADFKAWALAYSSLDLRAEMTARDAYLASEQATDMDRKNWFISTSKYLANRNMEARAKGSNPKVTLDMSGMVLKEVV